jgi:C4-dicarboxylate-specific signal transduction histidine kinase
MISIKTVDWAPRISLAENQPLNLYIACGVALGVISLLIWHLRLQQAQLSDLKAHNVSRLIQVSRAIIVGRISASLAHDLRQPISAILLNAQGAMRFIRQSENNIDGLSESMTDIVSDVNRMNELVESLRGLLEPETKSEEKLDANEEILSTLNLLKGKLLKMSLKSRAELATDLPTLIWKRSDFRQIVATLLLDALDSMIDAKRENRSILIRSEKGADETIILTVEDMGDRKVSILNESLTKSVEPTPTDLSSIHLRSCSEILKYHGGDIKILPTSTVGVTVRLIFPTRPTKRP